MPAPAQPETPPQRAIIFSGHMVDASGRPAPRSPSKENRVRERLAAQVRQAGGALAPPINPTKLPPD
ncbi:MAG: hypothetical protein H0T87_02545 [Gammaproteobacteria bacterium]|nr:hypothetical protein [Gammaproteobacteria bacterium]